MTPFRVFFSLPLALLLLTSAVSPVAAGTLVAFADTARPGTIVVETGARRLYFVLSGGEALEYRVGVGRAGLQWAGVSSIAGRYTKPSWAPPAAIRLAQPELPTLIAGGAPGNPMGAGAMTLAGTDYAIHGTNNPNSIGGFVSYGCIRMFNDDILDLMGRVHVGTVVEVRL